ncbi:carbon storage regulator CsrA [Pseudomonas guariconensis]|uniref:carbon storage regulator CsrA n=1 Tax=Pseudomonas guariconensis TaxID=1288410 RepID=UPI0018A89009|nr:carbon storage regulator CsrA [Pseudomonas guariconensis]MBF8756171.1 carbon storage regulator CsrA [Pseudomonas guariconensis]
MLVIGRQVGQAIKIRDNITIQVLSVQGEQVRLGIQAPDHITVNREEISESVKQALAARRQGKRSVE